MHMIKKTLFVVGLGLAAVSSTACKKDAPADTTPKNGETKEVLFKRLGGMDGITTVIKAFIANVGADDRINARFKGVDLAKLEKLMIEQVCNASGGPCEYTGRDMKTTHTGMKVTEEEWTATVEDLVKAMKDSGVADAEQGEVLAALGGMKPDIVGI